MTGKELRGMTATEFMDSLPEYLAHDCLPDERCPTCGKLIDEAKEGGLCGPKVQKLADLAGVSIHGVRFWVSHGSKRVQVPNAGTRARLGLREVQ